MSTAESSWANRSSSIFSSSDATGCSKSRNVVFNGIWISGARRRSSRAALYMSFVTAEAIGRAGSRCASVVDRQRVEAAPQVPRRDRAPRLPVLGDLARFLARHGLAAEVMQADRLQEA